MRSMSRKGNCWDNSGMEREWSGNGAGEGNRTLVVGLGSLCSTIELHPLTYSSPADCSPMSGNRQYGYGRWRRIVLHYNQLLASSKTRANQAVNCAGLSW